MTRGPSIHATTEATTACANCGRALAAASPHRTADVTSRGAELCDDCWFDAEKE